MIETIFKVSPDGSITVVDAIPTRLTLLAQSNSLEISLTRAKNDAAERGRDVFVYPVGDYWYRSTAAPRPPFKPGDRVRHIVIQSRPTGTVVDATVTDGELVPVYWDRGAHLREIAGLVVGANAENLELLED